MRSHHTPGRWRALAMLPGRCTSRACSSLPVLFSPSLLFLLPSLSFLSILHYTHSHGSMQSKTPQHQIHAQMQALPPVRLPPSSAAALNPGAPLYFYALPGVSNSV